MEHLYNMEASTLEKCIEQEAERAGFLSYNVEKRLINSGGNSLLGELYDIDIEGDTKNGKRQLHLFAKKMGVAAAKTMIEYFRLADAYKMEAFFYLELSKIYHTLQDDFNIPFEERLKMIKGYGEFIPDTILLENVSIKGFKCGHRMEDVSLRFAELSMEQLARFHGMAFVLEKLRPDYYDAKIKSIKSPLPFTEGWKSATESVMIMTASNIKDPYYRKIAEGFVPIALKKYITYYTTKAPIMCLIHGDYRSSNVLERTQNAEVAEVIPIDFQLMHYGCPVHDIIFFIFLGTNRKFRQSYFTHLKDTYHNSLKRLLKSFQFDVEAIFPRKLFDDLLQERLDAGLIFSLFFMPLLFAKEGSVIDVGEEDITHYKPKLDDKFQDRIKGIIDDMIEGGYVVE